VPLRDEETMGVVESTQGDNKSTTTNTTSPSSSSSSSASKARSKMITIGSSSSKLDSSRKRNTPATSSNQQQQPDDDTSKGKKQPQAVFCMVRHGERLDEVPGNDWFNVCGDLWHDPPLTELGKFQAKEAGTQLLLSPHYSEWSVIYSSPLLRTVQTAYEMSKVMNRPIQILYGLGECAAAVRAGQRQFRSIEELTKFCPHLKLVDGDHHSFHREQFIASLTRIGTSHGTKFLCVTHREGIRELGKKSGLRLGHVTYCGVAHFSFEVHDEPQMTVTQGHKWTFIR